MVFNTRFSTYIRPELSGILPNDLKREILETAAYLNPNFALRLAVVSRDVQPWAERIIYRELYFSGQRSYHHLSHNTSNKPLQLQRFKVVLEARPPAFFAQYVRALHFDGICDVEDVLPIIQVCTGVTNFGMYASFEGPRAPEIMRIVHSIPLHTLFVSNKNLTALFTLYTPLESSVNEGSSTSAEKHAERGSHETSSEITDSKAPLARSTQSSLHTLRRLGLVDGFEYPTEHFPALTHLALSPDFEDKVLHQVKAALENSRIESVVVMLNFINAPRQTKTLRRLRENTDSRLILFTLPVSPSRYIEDDLWDLANEFPDEEQPLTYLEEIPSPRILSFQELMEIQRDNRPKDVVAC
ncbi:hypothetical protein C0992_002255 [Termitomyces sp. T32_za158]|nr:hypothetical protein C0992_002255 [Termitomyces sp. T32_za158]